MAAAVDDGERKVGNGAKEMQGFLVFVVAVAILNVVDAEIESEIGESLAVEA